MREDQVNVQAVQGEVNVLQHEFHINQDLVNDLTTRIKERDEFCETYKSIVHDTANRQMASYALRMKVVQLSGGHVLDTATATRVTIPDSTIDDGHDIPVNGEIDLFKETKMKRKTGTCR